MKDYNLGFITNEDVYDHVKLMIESNRREITLEQFDLNNFKSAGNGWCVSKEGFDVANDDLHIYAVLKNKHKTTNSSSLRKIYMKMQAKLLDDEQAICYLVESVSEKSENEIWTETLDGYPISHKRIRRMSMDKFYELVFKDPIAFRKLRQKLPEIINDVICENSVLKHFVC